MNKENVADILDGQMLTTPRNPSPSKHQILPSPLLNSRKDNDILPSLHANYQHIILIIVLLQLTDVAMPCNWICDTKTILQNNHLLSTNQIWEFLQRLDSCSVGNGQLCNTRNKCNFFWNPRLLISTCTNITKSTGISTSIGMAWHLWL